MRFDTYAVLGEILRSTPDGRGDDETEITLGASPDDLPEALGGAGPPRLVRCDLCRENVPVNPWAAPDAACPHGCFDG